MDAYVKHPCEDLTDAQLDGLLEEAGMPFTEARRRAIRRRLADGMARRPAPKAARAKWLIPLVALLALALVGFTRYDAVTQLFVDLFGSRAIGQYAEPLSGSSTDRGVRLALVSGVRDGDNTYIVASLTDESGTHDLRSLMIGPEQWALSGYGGLYGGNCRMVQYDEETNTALLLIHGVGGTTGKSATFRLKAFGGGRVEFDFAVPGIDLERLAAGAAGSFVPFEPGRAGMGIADAGVKVEAALEKGDLDIAIPGFDRTLLSNIGYREGYLHLQFDSVYDTPNQRVTPYLQNPDTGEVIESAYSTNYDGSLDLEEYVFPIGDAQSLKSYRLCLEGWYYADTVTGDWEICFAIPRQMEGAREILDAPITLGGLTVDSIRLSPMNITLAGDLPAGLALAIEAEYKDGTVKAVGCLDDNSWLPYGANATPAGGANITFTHPIADFEDIAAIHINGRRIPVNPQ